MKKSQAAMEFLMTYGWALLVVLAAIGALAYFGVLKPQQFVPEQCVLVPGMACMDSRITPTGLDFIISNSLGRDIKILSISAGNCTASYNQTLDNGDESRFTIPNCNNGEIGLKFKSDLTIIYVGKDTGLEKTILGTISGKVQPPASS
jgi:hypothetical protein